MLYKSIGTLSYSIAEVGYRLVLETDQNIADFYRTLIPKYKCVKRQKYNAHISVVRHEIPLILENWGKYQDKEIEFFYDNQIKFGKIYFWLNCFSKELEYIRKELGLPVSSEYTRPPDTYEKVFHMTIGNVK